MRTKTSPKILTTFCIVLFGALAILALIVAVSGNLFVELTSIRSVSLDGLVSTHTEIQITPVGIYTATAIIVVCWIGVMIAATVSNIPKQH